jgi:hypothetical protein
VSLCVEEQAVRDAGGRCLQGCAIGVGSMPPKLAVVPVDPEGDLSQKIGRRLLEGDDVHAV